MSIIKQLEHKVKTIELDIIKEIAWEYVDEDWKSKEEIMEEHEEIMAEIENIDPQDEENKIWDAWWFPIVNSFFIIIWATGNDRDENKI